MHVQMFTKKLKSFFRFELSPLGYLKIKMLLPCELERILIDYVADERLKGKRCYLSVEVRGSGKESNKIIMMKSISTYNF